jgi:hypothetical protein
MSAKVTISFRKNDLFSSDKYLSAKKPIFDGQFSFRKNDLFFRKKKPYAFINYRESLILQ